MVVFGESDATAVVAVEESAATAVVAVGESDATAVVAVRESDATYIKDRRVRRDGGGSRRGVGRDLY